MESRSEDLLYVLPPLPPAIPPTNCPQMLLNNYIGIRPSPLIKIRPWAIGNLYDVVSLAKFIAPCALLWSIRVMRPSLSRIHPVNYLTASFLVT